MEAGLGFAVVATCLVYIRWPFEGMLLLEQIKRQTVHFHTILLNKSRVDAVV
jgi:hypothetical protein